MNKHIDFEPHHWNNYQSEKAVAQVKRGFINVVLAALIGWLLMAASFPSHTILAALVGGALVAFNGVAFTQKYIPRVAQLTIDGDMLFVKYLNSVPDSQEFNLAQLQSIDTQEAIILMHFQDGSVCLPNTDPALQLGRLLIEQRLHSERHYQPLTTSKLYDIRLKSRDNVQRELVTRMIDERTNEEQAEMVEELLRRNETTSNLLEKRTNSAPKISIHTACYRCGGLRIVAGDFSYGAQVAFIPKTKRYTVATFFRLHTFSLSQPMACLDCGLVYTETSAEPLNNFVASQNKDKH